MSSFAPSFFPVNHVHLFIFMSVSFLFPPCVSWNCLPSNFHMTLLLVDESPNTFAPLVTKMDYAVYTISLQPFLSVEACRCRRASAPSASSCAPSGRTVRSLGTGSQFASLSFYSARTTRPPGLNKKTASLKCRIDIPGFQ